MKQKLNKIILRITKYILPLIFIIYIANSVILRISTPDKFEESKWKGNWQSENFGFIGGKIIANLPDQIPNNEEFDVEAMIYYNIWGFYNMGGVSEFKLKGTLGTNNSGGGQNQFEENRDIKLSPSFNFKAKAISNNSINLEYSGIANRDKTIIVGGYKSKYPRDIGSFTIEKNE